MTNQKFTLNENGLFFSNQQSDDGLGTQIAGPFEILGKARTKDGQSWGKLLKWVDPDGRLHWMMVADARLHADPSSLCGEMAALGLHIAPNKKTMFQNFLGNCQTDKRVTIVESSGWHSINGKWAFALPTESITTESNETIIFERASKASYEKGGSLIGWKNGIGNLSDSQNLLVVAISTALSGPLLKLANMDGGGINLHGSSSIGKTTALQAAASVWGKGSNQGYVKGWRATANGLEGEASNACDTCLVLDELGLIESKELSAALYALSNGTGKQRADRNGDAKAVKKWRVAILSSGEVPIDTKLQEDRSIKARAGQLIRILDVPADRGLGLGIFDHHKNYLNPSTLAARIKEEAIQNYGWAGPEFTRQLLVRNYEESYIRNKIDDFVRVSTRNKADGQVIRAAERFGLIALAGELAIDFGLVPWEKGMSNNSAKCAFDTWIAQRGGYEPRESTQIVATLRRFIESYGESRFDNPNDLDAKKAHNRAGYTKGHGSDQVWLIFPETFRSEIFKGFDVGFACKILHDKGILEKETGSHTKVAKVAGHAMRFYMINTGIFETEKMSVEDLPF